MKRIISVLLLAVILVSSLSACNVKYHSNNAEKALTIGTRDISYDMFTYFYMSYKTAAGNENKTSAEILENTLTTLKEIVAIQDMAEKYDIELSKDTLKNLKLEMEMMEDSYPDTETMISDLAKEYLTQQVYYDISYNMELEAMVSSYLAKESNMIIISSDKVVEEAIRNTFMAAEYIVIYPESEKDGLKGKALADSLYERIMNGEDIKTLAEEYSEDKLTGPRYFAPLTMQKSFEDKVKSLAIGEVSAVYEEEYGYYITKRIPLSDDYINEHFNDLRDEYKFSEYLKIMTELTSKYQVVYADGFDIANIGK